MLTKAPISVGAGAQEAESQLRTDHLLHNLKSRTISSGIITTAAQSVKFGLTLASAIILSRLLTPSDFGLVAMVTSVTGFLGMFRDAGLSTATVQREGITHAQVSNLFWINFGLSSLITLFVAMMAPGIAWFYHEPRLIAVTLALSTTFLLSGSIAQHQAILTRQMRFKAIAVIDIVSSTAAFGVGVGMAIIGYSYWSLVAATLSLTTVTSVLTWLISGWRPQLPSRRCGTLSLVKFGAGLTLSTFMGYFARGFDSVLIGKFYGAGSVGLYSRATSLLQRPLDQFLSPVQAVIVPVLSRLQNDPIRYRRSFLQIYEAIAVVWFPCTGVLLVTSYPLILLLLGSKWVGAAVIFAGFTFAALYAPLACAATWLMTSQGRTADILKSSSILNAIAVASILAGLPFGPVGVTWSYSLSGLFIRLPILYYIAGRAGFVTNRDLWRGFFRHFPGWVSVVMASKIALRLSGGLPPAAQLGFGSAAGILAEGVLLWCYTPARSTVYVLVQSLLRHLNKKGNRSSDFSGPSRRI